MTETSGYKDIFKSTALFSIVKVISIAVRVVINKAVAVLLGTQGMGMIGMFYSSTDILRTVSGLGISQSAVRDVATAFATKDRDQLSKVVALTRRVVIYTGLLGALLTVLLSPFLSKWSFGSYNYLVSFMFLGIFTFASVVYEGQTAIIRGVRNLRALAKATLFGAVIGLVLSVPLYYIFGEKGIIPSMIVVSLSTMAFSWSLVSKIDYKKIKITLRETISGSNSMIKLGITLTYITLLGLISDYIIRIFIAKYGSLEEVGIYQAGVVLLTSYFGIVITALNTDYYPRMYSVAQNNNELRKQMDMQVNTAFLMLAPIIFIFIILMPIFIQVLYSSKFLGVINYLQFAIFSLLVNIYADTLGVVLIAKQETRLLALINSVYRIVSIPILILGYLFYGFLGLGVMTILNSIIHLLITCITVFRKYKIIHNSRTNKNIGLLTGFIISASLTAQISDHITMYLISLILLILLLIYTYKQLKTTMKIDLIVLFREKLESLTRDKSNSL